MAEDQGTFTTEDYLAAIGRELKTTRASLQWLTFIAVVQLIVLGLWLLGVITVEFEPTGGF